jgi:hypothetical protein
VPLIGWSLLALVLDIGLNFMIPTTILGIVIWQLTSFFGYRFNLLYQASMVFKVLSDIGILMLVGSLPDYGQGLIKLWWVLSGKLRRAPKLVTMAAD